ncbi:hypothetical protein ACX5K5_15215 [Glutamicibacter bergerei]
MKKKLVHPAIALGLVSALLLTGCAATANNAGGEASATPSTKEQPKELTAIEKVRKADPDLLGEHLAYKSIGENANGKYVVLGANTTDGFDKFAVDRWKSTGKNWTEKDMAQMQMMSIDFVYGTMFSGQAVGGNKADHKVASEATAKLFSKESGNQDQIRELFAGPDDTNPFTAFADPKSAFFEGYEVYQNASSSRYRNPSVAIMSAESHDRGSKMESGAISEIDGATVKVSTSFDLKLTKGGKTYTKPGELEYDLIFVKRDDGKVYHHGLESTGGDMSAEPVATKF